MECHCIRAQLLEVYVEVLVRGEGKREGGSDYIGSDGR